MYFITVSNGLLSNRHRKRIGTAIWEFLWILDKTTKIDKHSLGWVLGGKPINLKDIASQIGTSDVTTSRNLKRLADSGYINLIHTSYGIRISVNKAKKRFNKSAKGGIFFLSRFITYVKTRFKNDKRDYRNDRFNKTRTVDKKYDSPGIWCSPQVFFEEAESRTGLYRHLVEQLASADYYSKMTIHDILSDGFIPYWREKNTSELKERWQKEMAFDVILRAKKWIKMDHEFRKDWKCKKGKWHQKDERCYCT